MTPDQQYIENIKQNLKGLEGYLKLKEEVKPCPHGRESWFTCPHCLGLDGGV